MPEQLTGLAAPTEDYSSGGPSTLPPPHTNGTQTQKQAKHPYTYNEKIKRLLFFLFLRQNLIMSPWLSWNLLCRLAWPQTQRDTLASAFWVLGLKSCATIPCRKKIIYIFLKEKVEKYRRVSFMAYLFFFPWEENGNCTASSQVRT